MAQQQYPSLDELIAAQKYGSQGGPGAAIQSGLEGAISGNQIAFQQKLMAAKQALESAQTKFYTSRSDLAPGLAESKENLEGARATALANKPATSAAAAGTKQQATDEKALVDLGNMLTANKNSRSPASQAQISLNNIQRAKALVDQVRQQPGGPDTRQTYELALAQVRSLIGAQQISEKEVDALKPSTFKGSALAFLEKIQNEPIGQDQISFMNRLSDTLNREQNVNTDVLNQFKAQVLTAHKGLIQRNPQDAGDVIAANGLDPSGFIPGYKPSAMATSLFPKSPIINPPAPGAGAPGVGPGTIPGAGGLPPAGNPGAPLQAAAGGAQAPLQDPKAALRAKLGL